MRQEASKKASLQQFGLPLFLKVDHRANSSATSNCSPGDPYLAHSFDLVAVRNVAFPTASAMAAKRVRRDKAALSSGCKSHPANAPAGSNRSSHGGDESAEAFGVAGSHIGDARVSGPQRE